jgi:hypothetical protein
LKGIVKSFGGPFVWMFFSSLGTMIAINKVEIKKGGEGDVRIKGNIRGYGGDLGGRFLRDCGDLSAD